MKVSLALGANRPLSRETAIGCLTSNLALPGSGSLLAGRRSGYAQMALSVLGLIITTAFGVPFIIWSLKNWSHLYGDTVDPLEALSILWHGVRIPLVGILLFAFGWLWGLGTGMALVRQAKTNAQAPPKL